MLNYGVHTNAQETLIDTAFVHALTSSQPMVTVAQARAARKVVLRPRIWNADGVSVLPNPDMESNHELQSNCHGFEVGDSNRYFFVCADSLTPAQMQLLKQWALNATPQAALALQTVPQKAQGFSPSANPQATNN